MAMVGPHREANGSHMPVKSAFKSFTLLRLAQGCCWGMYTVQSCDKISVFTWIFTHFSESVRKDREPHTKTRPCMFNEKEAVQMHSDTPKPKTVPEKIPRRCAAIAANKIKTMCNLKEVVSGPENVGIRTNSRKLPYRQASAAAKKRLPSVYKEDDAPVRSENEKQLYLRRFRFRKEKAQQSPWGRKGTGSVSTSHTCSCSPFPTLSRPRTFWTILWKPLLWVKVGWWFPVSPTQHSSTGCYKEVGVSQVRRCKDPLNVKQRLEAAWSSKRNRSVWDMWGNDANFSGLPSQSEN